MTMGEIIKRNRQRLHLSQEALGEQLGVNKAAVQKWESGRVKNLKTTVIIELAEIFDISPSELMGWGSRPTEEQIQAWDEASNPKLADNVKLILEIEKSFGKPSVEMLNQFNELNDIGKEKAIEYVSDLTDNEKYTEKNTPGSACG